MREEGEGKAALKEVTINRWQKRWSTNEGVGIWDEKAHPRNRQVEFESLW